MIRASVRGIHRPLDTKRVQWTEPYIFFTTGDPGTQLRPNRLERWRDFVIGMDLMLRDPPALTMNIAFGIALVTEDLRVLALPAAPSGIAATDWFGNALKKSADLKLAR